MSPDIREGCHCLRVPGLLKGNSSIGEGGNTEWKMWLREPHPNPEHTRESFKTCLVLSYICHVILSFQGLQIVSHVKNYQTLAFYTTNHLKYTVYHSVCKCTYITSH